MGYNHIEAFQPAPEFDNALLNQIAVAAIIRYKQEFPHVATVRLQMWPQSKNVELIGEESVFYTWKELGF